jgi:hypothetical protein
VVVRQPHTHVHGKEEKKEDKLCVRGDNRLFLLTTIIRLLSHIQRRKDALDTNRIFAAKKNRISHL